MRFPLDARLKDGTRIHLLLADQQDREPLRRLYKMIVEEGISKAMNVFNQRAKESEES